MVIYRPLALTLTVSIDSGGNRRPTRELRETGGDQIKVTQTDVVESNTHGHSFTHSVTPLILHIIMNYIPVSMR